MFRRAVVVALGIVSVSVWPAPRGRSRARRRPRRARPATRRRARPRASSRSPSCSDRTGPPLTRRWPGSRPRRSAAASPSRRAWPPFITSVRKRFDRAIDRAIADVRKQAFHGGGAEMNLANGGVDLALPGRLAPRTLKLVEKARAALVSGRQAACVPYEEPPLAWNFPPRPAAP